MKPSRVIAFFMALLCASPAFSGDKQKKTKGKDEDPFIRTIQAMKLSTVRVACAKPEPDNNIVLDTSEGSGFFVATDGTFLTAGHVAHGLYLPSPPRKQPCQKPVIYISRDGWKVAGNTVDLRWFAIKGCVYDDDLDLAKCTTTVNPFMFGDVKVRPLAVTLDESVQEEGTQIAFTGFPLDNVVPVTARATIGTYWGLPGESGQREMIIDHNNWPGASGAPVYLSNGKVIGLILRRGINEATGVACARSGKFLVDFLDKKQ